MTRLSLPSRERGLKSAPGDVAFLGDGVAPFTGAWIEIRNSRLLPAAIRVAPFTGAWIEICSALSTVLS